MSVFLRVVGPLQHRNATVPAACESEGAERPARLGPLFLSRRVTPEASGAAGDASCKQDANEPVTKNRQEPSPTSRPEIPLWTIHHPSTPIISCPAKLITQEVTGSDAVLATREHRVRRGSRRGETRWRIGRSPRTSRCTIFVGRTTPTLRVPSPNRRSPRSPGPSSATSRTRDTTSSVRSNCHRDIRNACIENPTSAPDTGCIEEIPPPTFGSRIS